MRSDTMQLDADSRGESKCFMNKLHERTEETRKETGGQSQKEPESLLSSEFSQKLNGETQKLASLQLIYSHELWLFGANKHK